MILSDRDIKKYLEDGKIRVLPPIDLNTQLGPCSIDLRLGYVFKVFETERTTFIDTQSDTSSDSIMREISVADGEPFIMRPGELALATTYESLELPDDLLARLEGRSSLARLGIIVHGTAGVFEPGWRGRATLELDNLGPLPIAIYPLMRICSFTFETLSSPSEVPYWKRASSKYVGQQGADASRLGAEKDIEIWWRAFRGPGAIPSKTETAVSLKRGMRVYISGHLVSEEDSEQKALYEQIAEVCQEYGLNVYLPHQHTSLLLHPEYTPREIYEMNRRALLESQMVIAYTGASSLNVGGELELAHQNNIPAVLLYNTAEGVPGYVRGIPSVVKEIEFNTPQDCLVKLSEYLQEVVLIPPQPQR